MILGSDKTKLSKRHGATAVTEYIDLGYLPEALVNYLSRLGWSSGDQEIFSPQELIEKFSLENVGKAPSVFNPEKLRLAEPSLYSAGRHRHGLPRSCWTFSKRTGF